MKSLIIIILIILLNTITTGAVSSYDDFNDCSCNPTKYQLKDDSNDLKLCEKKCGNYKVTCYNRETYYVLSEGNTIKGIACEKELLKNHKNTVDDLHNSYIILLMFSLTIFAFMIICLIIKKKEDKNTQNENYNRILKIPCPNSDSSKSDITDYITVDIYSLKQYGNVINSSFYGNSEYTLRELDETSSTSSSNNHNDNDNDINK